MPDVSAATPPHLDALLALEPGVTARALRRAYDEASDGNRRPVVLFGCGALGRRTLDGLRRAGKTPIALTDNNPANWGSEIGGVAVLPPAEAVKAYGGEAVFVVTIYNGSAARAQLRSMGSRWVVHFAALYQAFPEALMPHGGVAAPSAILSDRDAVRAASEVWADEASRDEYLRQLAWRLAPGLQELPPPGPEAERYFPPGLFELRADDVFVDCGAFDGDSLRDLLARRGNALGGFVGLEPDPQNFARLSACVAALPPELREKIAVHPLAVASEGGSIKFCATASPGSSVAADGEIEVECVALDTLAAELHPTFIKMDVEGNELDALMGARRILERDRPILAICLYHKPEDLWQIPLFIKSAVPDYRLFLGRYAEDCWELVCYAVPGPRLTL